MAKLYGKGTITEIIKGKKYLIKFSGGKHPKTGKYRQIKETFLGTKRGAELRVEEIRREIELENDLISLGLDVEELTAYGLTIQAMTESGMSAAKASEEYKRRKDDEAKKILFADWLEKYMDNRISSGRYRASTLSTDKSIAKHLTRGLGAVFVADITPEMCESLYTSMRKNGVGDTTVRLAHKMLKRVMSYAANNDIIARNPVDRIEAPKKPKPQRIALGADSAQKLSGLCLVGKPSANKTAVYLGLSLGARLGEVLGLTWGHIVLEGARPFVHIVQQFTAKGETAPLKTDKDDAPDPGRIVPLDDSTVAVLQAWKAEQRIQLNVLGIEQGSNTPVVSSSVGTFMGHSRFNKWWQSFCVGNGFGQWVDDDARQVVELTIGDDASLYDGCTIEWRDSDGWPCDANGKRYSRTYKRPKIKRHYSGLHFHELRHTHFTMRLAAGMDIPTAQALGGWTTPQMLLNVYTHGNRERAIAVGGCMDEIMKKAVEQHG